MENVTLLWTLKEIIEHPNEHVLRDEGQSWHQLSLQREKTLANVFAFLSATHDDTCKITAVCIEESRHDDRLTIRTASNTGDCSYIRSGFEDIARILEMAHKRGRATSYHDAFPLTEIINAGNAKEDDCLTLLRCITRMDQQKILCRLRSRHAARTRRTSNKRSPLIHLHEAVQDPSIRANGAAAHTDLRRLREKAKELGLMFTQFESKTGLGAVNPESLETLSEILQTVHAFKSTWTAQLIAALRSSPKIDPSMREYLPIAIGKLARYSEATRYLISLARNRSLSVFSNVKVESAQICLPNQPLFQGPFPSLEQSWKNVIDATTPARGHKMNLTIESFLGRSYHDDARNFEARVSTTSTVWKIHAEIQLLVYHELNPDQPKPRVIASSKDACYLCNLFLGLHGQFQVSKTHGRIYDRWILPDWVEFPPTSRDRMSLAMEQLNARVEKTIIATVSSQRMSYSHPNESNLFSIKSCSSSTVNALRLPTPLHTPPTSGLAYSSKRPPARLPQKGSDISACTHRVSAQEGQPISDPDIMEGETTRTSVDVSRTLPSTPILARDEEARITDRNQDDLRDDSRTPVPERQCRSSQFPPASAMAVITAATPRGMQEPSSSLSSEKLEPRSNRTIEVLQSASILSSNYSDNSKCDTINPDVLSTLVTNSQEPLSSRPKLTRPGEAFSRVFTSATDEFYVQTGNLHLTLGREVACLPHIDHPRDCMISVKWLVNQELSRLMASNYLQQIIDARDIPMGGAITVSRGCSPENEILLSCGPDILISIGYSFAPPE